MVEPQDFVQTYPSRIPRERFKVAVTRAFGPQYLYNTKQFHTSGANKGFSVQLVAEPRHNALIPDVAEEVLPSSFCVLNRARALGNKGPWRGRDNG